MSDYRLFFENNTYIYRFINRITGDVLLEGETSGKGSRTDAWNEAHIAGMKNGLKPLLDSNIKFWLKRKEA